MTAAPEVLAQIADCLAAIDGINGEIALAAENSYLPDIDTLPDAAFCHQVIMGIRAMQAERNRLEERVITLVEELAR